MLAAGGESGKKQMTIVLHPDDNRAVWCDQAFRHEEACYEESTERLEELDQPALVHEERIDGGRRSNRGRGAAGQ